MSEWVSAKKRLWRGGVRLPQISAMKIWATVFCLGFPAVVRAQDLAPERISNMIVTLGAGSVPILPLPV